MKRLQVPLGLCLAGVAAACSLQMPAEGDLFASKSEVSTGGVADGSGGDGGNTANAQGGTSGRGTASDAGIGSLNSIGGQSTGGTGEGNGFATDEGLVAHYPFDETSGEVAANLMDAGKNGTYVGNCTHPPGQIGAAVGLRNIAGTTATTEWVELPDGLLSDLAETTMVLWTRDLSSTRSGGRLFHFSSGTANEIYFAPHDTDLAQRAGSRLGGTYNGDLFVDQWSAYPDFTDKLWHHVAVAWSSARIDLYIDGDLAGSTSSPGVRPADLGVTSPNWLGRTLGDREIGLYVEIDDLRIYDRILTADDIDQLH